MDQNIQENTTTWLWGRRGSFFKVTWSSKVPKNLYFYADDELYLPAQGHLPPPDHCFVWRNLHIRHGCLDAHWYITHFSCHISFVSIYQNIQAISTHSTWYGYIWCSDTYGTGCMLKLIHEDVILCYCPYLRILKLHVDTKVDEQTMLFFYIEPFLPEDKVTEKCILFFVILPICRNAN